MDESLWNNGKKLNQTFPLLNETLKKTFQIHSIFFRLGTELMRKISIEKSLLEYVGSYILKGNIINGDFGFIHLSEILVLSEMQI